MLYPNQQITKSGINKNKINGYSIVELLVAIIVLSIAITAIVAVIRMGRELEIVDKHRRQARAIIDNKMEIQYNYRNFKTIPIGVHSNDDSTVIIDVSYTTPLTAKLRRIVTAGTESVGGNSTNIPIKKIDITVFWTEPDGMHDTIAISKWIAKAQ